MSARIIHFGDDRFNRLGCLRQAGYHVDVHSKIDSFRIAMHSGQPFDAVSLEEMETTRLDEAVALARRGLNVPLILFQASTKHRNHAEFSLVVALIDESVEWVGRLGELIERRRESHKADLDFCMPEEDVQRALSAPPSIQTAFLSEDRSRRRRISKAEPLAFESEQGGLKAAKSSQFLRSLTPEMLRELEAVTSFTFCAPGTVLFVESQLPHEVYFLLEGQVRLFMNAHDGRRLTVHIANAGEILGLAAVFTAAPHKTSAETIYPSRMGSIRCEDLMKFLMIHSKAAQAAARELSETCDRTYTRLRTIGVTPSNRAKLSRLILEWAAQGKQTERGLQIHVALKHGEIAECIGTCRESVTRILRDLQRWQVIELRGSLLTIADLPALEQCADLR